MCDTVGVKVSNWYFIRVTSLVYQVDVIVIVIAAPAVVAASDNMLLDHD